MIGHEDDIKPKRLAKQHAKGRNVQRPKKYEFNETDAIIAVALGCTADEKDNDFADFQSEVYDSSSDSSYDDEHLNLSNNPLYLSGHQPLKDFYLGRRRRAGGALMGATGFEVKSLLNGNKRKKRSFNRADNDDDDDRSMISIQNLKRGNILLGICIVLLLACTVLLYDRSGDQKNDEFSIDETDIVEDINENDDNISQRGYYTLTLNEQKNSKYAADDDNYPVGSGLNETSNNETDSQVILETETHNDTKPNSSDIMVEYKQEKSISKASVEETVEKMSVFSDWRVPFIENDIPVFWHVPRAGGTTLTNIVSHCHSLVVANQIGVTQGHGELDKLQVVDSEGGSYVNVDTTTVTGIKRAKEMGLIESGLADVIMTSYIHEIVTLVNSSNIKEGSMKCFTLIRHPIRRAESMFHNFRNSAGDELQNITIAEYANSIYSEENWMVRFLTNEMSEPLSYRHLTLALKVLGSKCIVGLLDKFDESIQLFDRYFGWMNGNQTLDELNNKRDCETYLIHNWDNTRNYTAIEEDSEEWNLLKAKNGYDLLLYEYVVKLFVMQTNTVRTKR